MKFETKGLPGLYQEADSSSLREQKRYFRGIRIYIFLLIIGALFSFYSDTHPTSTFKIAVAVSFLASLSILIWIKMQKPEEIWYNGRAVAESVKTRSWRFMMRAEPYVDVENVEIMKKEFIKDLKSILNQNKSLIGQLGISAAIEEPISKLMLEIRELNLEHRIEIYREQRILNQALWYSRKAKYNKSKSTFWFTTTVILHFAAIILTLYNRLDVS